MVTAGRGEVSGELDRIVSLDQDGEHFVRYETRIDGADAAEVDTDNADELNVWLRWRPSCPPSWPS